MFADDPSPRLPATAGEKRAISVFAGLLLALLFAEITSDFNKIKLSVLFALLAWVPLLVLHECGHALAARVVGWRVSEIVIGFGREWARFRIGQTRVRLRAAPLEGHVVPSPTRTDHARLKSAWIYAAGPGIELAYVAACAWWLGPALTQPTQDLSILAVQSSCMAALLGAGFNLLPYPSGNSLSDGLGIIASLAADNDSFRSQLASPFVREARTELHQEQPEKATRWVKFGLERYPEDWQLRSTQAVCLAAVGEGQAAFDALEALGDVEAKPPNVRVELLLDAAWTVLLNADSALMLDAQRACERALLLYPGHVRAHLLLGRVLLERGRPAEAFDSLMRAYKLTRERDYESQLVAYLAIASKRLGNADYTERFAAEARRQSIAPALHLRLRQELDGAR